MVGTSKGRAEPIWGSGPAGDRAPSEGTEGEGRKGVDGFKDVAFQFPPHHMAVL